MIKARTIALATLLAGAFAATSATEVGAQSITLAFPVDCTLGTDCFIQNYVDRDPSDARRDFGCGHLTYDGHSGTDIALLTEADLARNVAVTSVAPGRVRAIRDGMPDISIRAPNAPDITGRACGNAVVITHPHGWETRYCHLKSGSITVAQGDQVDTGTHLGSVGLSGRTEFPHLHLTLARDGDIIDPFQPADDTTCGATQTALWQDSIAYDAAGFISAGAAPAVPDFDTIKQGRAAHATLPNTAEALVFWAQLFGPSLGDTLAFRITAPDGSRFQDSDIRLDRDQVRAFRAVGRRLTGTAWPTGLYRAEITLIRDGREIDTIRATTQVQPPE